MSQTEQHGQSSHTRTSQYVHDVRGRIVEAHGPLRRTNEVGIGFTLQASDVTTMAGMSNALTRVSTLRLISNAALTSLDGLGGLTDIDGDIVITSNDALTDISGFSPANFSGDLVEISANTNLCEDDVDTLTAALSVLSPSATVMTSGNLDSALCP